MIQLFSYHLSFSLYTHTYIEGQKLNILKFLFSSLNIAEAGKTLGKKVE